MKLYHLKDEQPLILLLKVKGETVSMKSYWYPVKFLETSAVIFL